MYFERVSKGFVLTHFFLLSLQTKSNVKEVVLPMPYTAWCCLMTPVVDAEEGGDWQCDRRKEVFHVVKRGLGQLDYLFGITLPNLYNWKIRTFGLGSQCAITEMTFTFNLKKHSLKVVSRHKFPFN